MRTRGRGDVSSGPDHYCPHCGVAYEPTQEYCLECGERLPVNRGVVGVLAQGWQRHLAWYPGDWIWPVLLFLVLTTAATAVALAARAARNDSRPIVATNVSIPLGPGATEGVVPITSSPATLPVPTGQPTITTGALPAAPGTPSTGAATTPTPPANPNALANWPSDKSGYTLVLESLPLSAGHPAAVARARQAKGHGLPDVGVLVSSQYSSLHPGYYVVFSGIYGSSSEASAAVGSAHAKGFSGAYQAHITH
jgi:hypothetical protein